MSTTHLTIPENKLPTLDELVKETDTGVKENALMVLLNQPPPQSWIEKHPITKGDYLPVGKIEYLLSKVFLKWWLEIKDTKMIANSVVVTVRLHVVDPITGEEKWNDGIGAMPLQTDSGKGAIDFNYIKSSAVMMSAPAAESYAFKDAAEKFGKIFGKDLNRKQQMDYSNLIADRWKQQ